MWLVYSIDKEKGLCRADMFNCSPVKDCFSDPGFGKTEHEAKIDFMNKNQAMIDRAQSLWDKFTKEQK